MLDEFCLFVKLLKQGADFVGNLGSGVKFFAALELFSQRAVAGDGITAVIQRLNKAQLFGRQPVFAAVYIDRMPGAAGFAGHGNGISGDDDIVGAGQIAHIGVVLFFSPQISIGGNVLEDTHNQTSGFFAGAP